MEVLLVGRWLLAIAVLSALAVPIAARLFRWTPGRGVGLAPILSVAVLTTTGYWIGRLSFGIEALAVGVVALGVGALWASVDLDAARRGSLSVADDAVPADRRAIRNALLVFLGAFTLVLLIRAADPAITPVGGEKFLDYSLLRSLLRAESLPPLDPWFAGETVNYYYGGHLAAALVTILSGVPPAYAYNLALATVYACLIAAVFELARGIAADRIADRIADRPGEPADSENDSRHDHVGAPSLATGAGVAAAAAVGLASNLATVQSLLARLGPGSGAESEPFHYWDASRVIEGTINEFPFFAFLNGDLHAHMMGAPFLVLGTAIAYAYWRTPESELRRRRLLVFGAIPVLGGTVAVVHTWDLATLFGVVWLAATFAPARPLTLLSAGSVRSFGDDSDAGGDSGADGGSDRPLLREEIERTGGALVVTALAAGLGGVLAAPFLLGASSGQEPALVPPGQRSGLGGLLTVHGAFLAAFLAFLTGRLVGIKPRPAGTNARLDGIKPRLAGIGPLLVGLAAVVGSGLLVGVPAIAVVAPPLVLGWVALRTDQDAGFETALVIGGAGLVGLVEIVHLAEQAGPGRLNTVFKTYFQVWTLWGIAAGVIISELWAHGVAGIGHVRTTSGREKGSGGPDGRETNTRTSAAMVLPDGRTVARVLVALLVVSTLPYAALALDGHFDRHDVGTLDATAFVAADHPEEAPAIAWLDDHATREDVLLEAPGTTRSPEGLARAAEPGMYTWRANPASSLTGVPTVAGWDHEVGYRGVEAYERRVAAVDRAYAGPTVERVRTLDAYEVTYVWVGPTERERYGEDVAFDHLEGVSVAYETDRVTIYRVDQDALPG
ncbi:DUF2298 domain-containing protein [Halopenitus persicus]|uniref:Chlor_Arch_YYY domain-containing protein n=1 Tax=Halopenitus persicus TaxID=1048396 RepID=A0A1H3IR60_9EURY|nr:DUF2298 domain-containing protein [Halopenitus persicus]SDY30276.1 Chlor_Arch_YYY domain-containing protein [Halopenitus persicus]